MLKVNPLKNKWAAWVLWGLWCAMILKFSSDPATVSSGKSGWFLVRIIGLFQWAGVELSDLDFLHYLIRKTAHFLNYLCLGLVTYNALRLTADKYKQRLFAAAFMMTVSFAGLDEYFQTFVPGRSGQLKDVLIDSAGTGLGLWALWFSSFQSK